MGRRVWDTVSEDAEIESFRKMILGMICMGMGYILFRVSKALMISACHRDMCNLTAVCYFIKMNRERKDRWIYMTRSVDCKHVFISMVMDRLGEGMGIYELYAVDLSTM